MSNVRDELQAKEVSTTKGVFDFYPSFFLACRGEALAKTGQLHNLVIPEFKFAFDKPVIDVYKYTHG